MILGFQLQQAVSLPTNILYCQSPALLMPRFLHIRPPSHPIPQALMHMH
jgi:hypothetical protein